MTDGIDRRRFLKVLGVTGGGAAVLSGCGIGPEPTEKLIPYLVPPEDQIPGIPTWYASTCRECAAGCGIHVKVREGRAIKIEGNPESPINHGRLCARGQAALQGLYNPDRVTGPLHRNASGHLEPITWDAGVAALEAKVQEARGRGIVFVTGLESGSFGTLVDDWMQQVGGRHVTYEPFAFEALREGNRLAFGDASLPWYDFASAKYILSFGADFMETWLSPVGFQSAFTRAHSFESGSHAGMAKFVYVAPRMSQTGLVADEWLAVTPGTEGLLALAMAQVVVSKRLAPVAADVARLRLPTPASVAEAVGIEAHVIERLATEFATSGAGLAVAGGIATHYPNGAEIVAAVNILNYVAGVVGQTVKFGADLAQGSAGSFREVATLTSDMASDRVGLLLVHGANPLHSLGGGFAQAWGKVGFKVSFSSYLDETAAGADLVLPDLHPLEQWNDSRPRAGVYALQQPAMQPVFEGTRHTGDVVMALLARTRSPQSTVIKSFKDYLQSTWAELHRRAGGGKPFEQWWTDSLQHGGVYGDPPTRAVRLGPDAGSAILEGVQPSSEGGITAIVFPHPVLHDGGGANKPWLQELPDPVDEDRPGRLGEVHPETAKEWDRDGDISLIKSGFECGRPRPPIPTSVRPDRARSHSARATRRYGRLRGTLAPMRTRSCPVGRDAARQPATRAARGTVSRLVDHSQLVTTEGSARQPAATIAPVISRSQALEVKQG